MNRRRRKQILAFVLAFVLCLGAMPVDLFGGIAKVKAATTNTYTFDGALGNIGVADKAKVEDGTTFGDGYFKVVDTGAGNADWYMYYRVKDEAVYCVETGKQESGNLQFTVTGNATVSVVATSNGSSNTSDIALLDEAGAAVTEANGITTVTGSDKVTLTYTVGAGTYEIASPKTGSNTGRGVRLYNVTVVDTVESTGDGTDNDGTGNEEAGGEGGSSTETTNTYTFDGALGNIGVADKAKVEDGTTFGDGYFKVVDTGAGNADWYMYYRVKNEEVYCVETGKQESGNLQFTVKGNATVSVVATSNGSSNTSDIALLDEAGAAVTEANGITTVTGSDKVTLTYTVGAGTYEIASPKTGSNTGRGVRLYNVTVVDTVESTGDSGESGSGSGSGSGDDGNSGSGETGNTGSNDNENQDSSDTSTKLVTKSVTYNFWDGDGDTSNDIIPTTKGANLTDTITTDDGLMTIACGPSNGYSHNGDSHGAVFKTGNTITFKAQGNTKVIFGGCQYGGGTVQMSMNGTNIGTAVVLDTTNCAHQDVDASLKTVVLEYTGEAGDLVLTFNNDSASIYVPYITFEWQEEELVQAVGKSVTYSFWDGDGDTSNDIIPTTKGANLTDTITTDDGLMTIACGPSNGYSHNGDSHGAVFKTGNTITFKAKGDTKIIFGGCQYGGGTVQMSMNGTNIGSAVVLDTTNCAHQDVDASLKTVVLEYTGEAGDLVLTFNNDSASIYVPYITFEWQEEEVVQLVDKSATYSFWDGDGDTSNDIIPTTKGANLTDTITTDDGLMTIACGPSNGYSHNGDSHGAVFKTGNTITFKAKGDTKIIFGGCQYGGGTVQMSMNGTNIGSAVVLDTTNCAHQDVDDSLKTVVLEYTGEAGDLVLTFNNDSASIYVPYITFEWTEVAPNTVPLEIPVTIASGADVLGSDVVTIANVSDATDTHTVGKDGATLTLQSESTYKVSTKNNKIKATVGGKDTFATGEEAAAVAIDVESLVVNPVVKCEGLAEGKKLSLTYMEGETEKSIDLTVGEAVELWIGTQYGVKCDDETVEARVNDATSFKATADMTELKVELLSLVNKVTMTVNGSLGDAKVVMVNADDATDKVEFGNGDTVELKLNATYDISCTNEDLFALVAGKAKYTVATAISALTIDITAAEYHTYDVWDFGAEQFESTKYDTYNNMLNVDIINAFYPADRGYEVGGVNSSYTIPSFTTPDGGVTFNDGGYSTTHRLRTINKELTRRDEKSLKDADGVVYTGYIYSNKSNSSDVNFAFEAKAGDIFTFYVGSNGNACTYSWATEPGAADAVVKNYTDSAQIEKLTFYATKDATYYLWVSSNEKLVLARAIRETPDTVTVSGKLTIPADSDMVGGKIVFTQYAPDGTELCDIEAPITANDSYSVQLSEQYTYKVSLADKNGYIVDTNATADNGEFTLKCSGGNQTVDVTIVAVDLVTLTGKLSGLTAEEAAELKMTFGIPADKVYVPTFTITKGTNEYTLVVEKDVETTVKSVTGVDDYTLKTAIFKYSVDSALDLVFEKKPVYAINVTLEGPTAEEAKNAKYTFSRLASTLDGTLDGYVYNFTGADTIELRDGQYKVAVELDGYAQQATADVKVAGAAVAATVVMKSTTATEVAYKEEITVGTSGDYQTINDALDAVRSMNRETGQRVTISIEPGNYEEMLYVDVDNVTLKNAAGDAASIELTNKGVDIAENAVRITSYYGHGYSYYSMDENYSWNADVLAANKENGYESVDNPGTGTGTMWNATVRVYADGFQADGIIFENSFNQYMSKKAAEDVIVKLSGAKEGTVTRSSMQAGDVTVQQKAYVERAAALAMGNNLSDIVFDNCKFIGRQDTLYGGTNTYVEFNECSVYGGTDYIFGGMIAIFDSCDLVFNTSEDKNDVGYITAAQQSNEGDRGYLMLNCHVTSTTPGVDTASAYTSKPGYFGRPWAPNTSEVVFYNTTIDAADEYWHNNSNITASGKSLIAAEGWNESLSGRSAGMYEYGTVESSGVDNSASRVSWATMLTTDKLNDGTYITKAAFRKPVPEEGLYIIDISKGLKAGVNYDGGLSVLEDMPLKTEGFVQGATNATGEDGKSAKDYAIPVAGSAVKIVAEQDGRFKVELKAAAGKDFYWVDATDTSTKEKFQVATNETKVFALEAGHTYYLYGNGTKPCMYSLTIDYRPYVDWATVDAPTVGTPVVAEMGSENEGTITIPYAAAIGSVYSDSLNINVYCDGTLVDTISLTDETDPLKGYESSCTYNPEGSGSYTFKAVLKRTGTAGKESAMSSAVTFKYPMPTPVIINVENQGGGAAKFSWQEVNEATSYEVYLDGEKVDTVTVPYYRFTGLTVGTEYTFGVKALGNDDVSEMSTMKQKVTGDAQKTWLFSAFGQGVDTKNNKLIDGIDSADDTSLSLQSMSGKGKIVPASTDGLAFYYTTIDPETENFTLSADITVDEWAFSNGQEGFGIMAADAVGTHGDTSIFWNNSYMGIATKVEYYWNRSAQEVATSGTKYSMKLGLGSMERIGVTKDNIDTLNAGNLDAFLSSTKTLETLAGRRGMDAGTYNVVGNCTSTDAATLGTIKEQTTFHMTLQRNNTGYFVSYTDENGNTTTNKYYHGEEGDALTQIDPNNIYVGFFASRNAKITVDNVSLTTINPADDAPAEERPITYVSYKSTIESAGIANSEDYELVYYGTADGTLTIKQGENVIANELPVTAEQKYRFDTKIKAGKNNFDVVFTPDPDFVPSKYERLDSYKTRQWTHVVNYESHDRNIIYVDNSKSWGCAGTKEDPMSIYEAVTRVKPGDYIILLAGTFEMNAKLTITRGIDGTAEEPIYMVADPDATSRPVLDFGGLYAGMVLAGDYWYLQGFDVTNSAPGQKGLQVSGDYNVVDDIHAYRNGNTGIQISRFLGSDTWEDWPHDNLILNCTSYLNADPGYEDADGFAAKLTIGANNVFDGCIAAYNADDGWDLFAKVESGAIGAVTIKNSLAFKNGYDIDENGNEIDAGNGNGFKMGGSSMVARDNDGNVAHHVIENSVAFANKAKGFDSNSCPNIEVINCTGFDNGSFNVAFYTNEAANTDFAAEGLISYKVSNTVADSLKTKGSQDDNKIYKESNYYCFGKTCKNSTGEVVTSDWFVSLDTDAAIHGGITRDENGKINMNGYLELKEDSAVVQEMIANNKFFGAFISGGAANIYQSMNSGATKPEGSEDVFEQLPELVVKERPEDDDDDSTSDVSSSLQNATLEETIAVANGFKQSQYTAASWSAFQTALKAALAVLNNSAATPAEIAAAQATLANAIAALKSGASSPKTSFDEDSFIHSILWPETDSDKAVVEEGTATENIEAAADAEDVVIAGASLVQNAEENGMSGMLTVIIVVVVAMAAAAGIVIFRKREEEM